MSEQSKLPNISQLSLLQRFTSSVSFFNRTYRLFSEYSALLQNLEEYCYYEIQIHKALCEFAVKKGYCWLKEGLPP